MNQKLSDIVRFNLIDSLIERINDVNPYSSDFALINSLDTLKVILINPYICLDKALFNNIKKGNYVMFRELWIIIGKNPKRTMMSLHVTHMTALEEALIGPDLSILRDLLNHSSHNLDDILYKIFELIPFKNIKFLLSKNYLDPEYLEYLTSHSFRMDIEMFHDLPRETSFFGYVFKSINSRETFSLGKIYDRIMTKRVISYIYDLDIDYLIIVIENNLACFPLFLEEVVERNDYSIIKKLPLNIYIYAYQISEGDVRETIGSI